MRLVFTHNGGYDSVLLVNDRLVVSRWDTTPAVVADYVRSGANPDDWDVQTPEGIRFEDHGGALATVEDYGEVAGENGGLNDERREFYGI